MAAAASGARLGDLEGRGYLSIVTEGYRRAEGAFFSTLDKKEKILGYMLDGAPVSFTGRLYEGSSDRRCDIEVFVSSVREEGGQLRIGLVGLGKF